MGKDNSISKAGIQLGSPVQATHVTQLIDALQGAFVGRRDAVSEDGESAEGTPTNGEIDLGAADRMWRNLYANGVVIDGKVHRFEDIVRNANVGVNIQELERELIARLEHQDSGQHYFIQIDQSNPASFIPRLEDDAEQLKSEALRLFDAPKATGQWTTDNPSPATTDSRITSSQLDFKTGAVARSGTSLSGGNILKTASFRDASFS